MQDGSNEKEKFWLRDLTAAFLPRLFAFFLPFTGLGWTGLLFLSSGMVKEEQVQPILPPPFLNKS